jgi:hypothetical protein
MEFTGFQSVQNTYFNFDIAAYLIRIMFVKQGDVLIRTTAEVSSATSLRRISSSGSLSSGRSTAIPAEN